MPLQATSGAASYDGFGGGVPFTPTYIEDVFSTWLYTGNGSTQTITNGIDLAGKGGLVWIKRRDSSNGNRLNDTARGVETSLSTNNTLGNNTGETTGLTAFSASGFTVSSDPNYNTSAGTYASWTFRKQPKFFDVVTYTGTGANRTVAHNLGSVPGCIIVKCTSSSGLNWQVYHRSLGATKNIILNLADAEASNGSILWNNTAPTSTVFSLGTAAAVNELGDSYIAYLFAHDAGGFGLTGTDNVISCGSFTANGSGNATVSLGYEPQFLILKQTNGAFNWLTYDVMRGMSLTNGNPLKPNTSDAESSDGDGYIVPTATGFSIVKSGVSASSNWIYIAIRRGPMKTPTTGTSVYENTAYTGNGASNRQIGSSVLTDLLMLNNRDATAQSWSTYAQMFFDRLRGDNVLLATASTSAESTSWNSYIDFDMNAGWDTGPTTQQTYLNKTSSTYVSHAFRRAPGFFDVVCYTGTGSARTVTHNLGVAPEFLIVKLRDSAANWFIYSSTLGSTKNLFFSSSGQQTASAAIWNSTDPTASVFSVGTGSGVNGSGNTYVAYLFASCPGVSKVFSYTGNGTSQTINCGFTGGARFVMIKRTDSDGDWMVVDTARGLVAAGDPTLYLNSTASEVTGVDWLDPDSSGFIVNQESTMNANVNGGTYIGLAIA